MSAGGRLIALARSGRLPQWSRERLAYALFERGFERTAGDIAHLEESAPLQYDVELLAACALLLGIESDAVAEAILADYLAAEAETAARLGITPGEQPPTSS